MLSNALRYTPPGEAIVVRCQTVDHQVQVSVENPGTPIAPEHLPRLFDRFYRVDPSRQRKGEGSGIGLAIVKSIVVAHKGTVAVTSDARGTRFMIKIIWLSIGIGFLGCLGGLFISYHWKVPSGASIIFFSILIYAVCKIGKSCCRKKS